MASPMINQSAVNRSESQWDAMEINKLELDADGDGEELLSLKYY